MGSVARSLLSLRLVDGSLISITKFCTTESDDHFVKRARKFERNPVIFAHGCASVFTEVERLVCGDAKRNGAGNITRGDFLIVHHQRSSPALADARAIVFEIHNNAVLAGREIVLAGDGGSLDTDEVVVESRLPLKEVEPPAVEAPALRRDHTFRAAFRNLDIRNDFIRLVF